MLILLKNMDLLCENFTVPESARIGLIAASRSPITRHRKSHYSYQSVSVWTESVIKGSTLISSTDSDVHSSRGKTISPVRLRS